MTISVAFHAWSERPATLAIILMARPFGNKTEGYAKNNTHPARR
jgi:hypothetical protein